MTPAIILTGLVSYFLLLLGIGFVTGRKAGADEYFLGNKKSIWWLVAIGMLSDSMSGVSFISVPGNVLKTNFYYMQVILGYVFGYIAIAYVLLPLYYKHNLTSIYSFLELKLGVAAQKMGAVFFLLSRLVGAAGRLLLTAIILQKYLFDAWGFPFYLTVSIIIVLILSYTIKGGIRTLVFTDALQSVFLIGGLVLCIGLMISHIPTIPGRESLWRMVADSGYSSMFNWDVYAKSNFFKHFLGGAFMCIAMTGLDQNMMQKNLSCKSLKEAQKNMLTTAGVIFFVNILFLSLGIFMIEYLQAHNPEMLDPANYANGKVYTDGFFPFIALNHLGPIAGLAFILGLSAATFSSADSVLTTLTTSAYIDLFGFDKQKNLNEKQQRYRRVGLHIGFSVALLFTILFLRDVFNVAIIELVLGLAAYTYGPLLGLFALGIFTSRKPQGWGVVLVSILAPIVCGLTEYVWMANAHYKFGYEMLIINGLLSFVGYLLIPQRIKA